MSYETLSFAPFKDYQHLFEHTLDAVRQLPGFAGHPEDHPFALDLSCRGFQLDAEVDESPYHPIASQFAANNNQLTEGMAGQETGLRLRMHLPREGCGDLSLFSSVHTISATHTRQTDERMRVTSTLRKTTNQLLRSPGDSELLVIKQRFDETTSEITANKEGITLECEAKRKDTATERLLGNSGRACLVLQLGMVSLKDFLRNNQSR